MNAITHLSHAGVAWAQNIIGIIFRPYETYRRIVEKGTSWELAYIAIFLSVYFSFASLVKTSSLHPFLLTRKFVWLGVTSGIGYIASVFGLWTLGRLVRGKGRFSSFALAWAYTLIPTVVWFWITSLLYVIVPPPRSVTWLGVSFSIVYLVFSTTLLLWKFTLAYLSLRFGLRLDLQRILIIAVLAIPLGVLYGGLMHYFRVFRVPFL